MNIAIMIMMANKEPSLRNTNAFKEYVINDYKSIKDTLENKYKFIFYYGDKLSKTSFYKIDDDVYEIHTCNNDGIHDTFEKTIEGYKKLDEIDKFDYVVRINISLFLNIRLLDIVAKSFNPNDIYCNAINAVLEGPYTNTLYPRGDFYIISKQTIDKILKISDKFYINTDTVDDYNKSFYIKADHVDDVLMGCCLKEAIGNDYYDHIKMIYYNLLMQTIDETTDMTKLLNKHIIATRLKTTPAGQLSGYSWDDNDYRLNDVLKFKKCYEYFSKFEYEKWITIDKLFVDENKCRPITIVEIHNIQLGEFKKTMKRKGA